MNLLLVRTGDKYSPEYVERLIDGVRRNLSVDAVDVFTDQPEQFTDARNVDVSGFGLPGWWAKMALFHPDLRSRGNALYLDLDTIVLGDIGEFNAIATSVSFGICSSFVRQFGAAAYPCAYGSCVMTFRDGWGENVWQRFQKRKENLMRPKAMKFGDQLAIERLYPDAALLQPLLPSTFFLNYRELPDHPEGPPSGSRMVIFGGKCKPGNTSVPWVERAWRADSRPNAEHTHMPSAL